MDAPDVRGASHDGETVWAAEGQQTIPGRLNQAATLEGHVEEELGMVLPREGPQARTSASGRDDHIETGNFTNRPIWISCYAVVPQGRCNMHS